MFVLVTGVGDEWFTEEATSGQRWSQPVRVEGGYGGGTLAVNRVEPFTPTPPSGWSPPSRADPPPRVAGRAAASTRPSTRSAVANALTEQVAANPDRYTDLWEGHPDGRRR